MARNTGRLPRALEERPEIEETDLLYFEAFATLSHFRKDRNSPLNFKDITEYADRLDEDALEFVSIMIRADNAYLKVVREDKKILANEGDK